MNAARIRGESEAGAALGVMLVVAAVVSGAAWAVEFSPARGGWIPIADVIVLVIAPVVLMLAAGIWLLLRDRGATRSLVAGYLGSPLVIAVSLVVATVVTALVVRWQFHLLFEPESPSARPFPYRGAVRMTGVFVVLWALAGCLGALWVVGRRRV